MCQQDTNPLPGKRLAPGRGTFCHGPGLRHPALAHPRRASRRLSRAAPGPQLRRRRHRRRDHRRAGGPPVRRRGDLDRAARGGGDRPRQHLGDHRPHSIRDRHPSLRPDPPDRPGARGAELPALRRGRSRNRAARADARPQGAVCLAGGAQPVPGVSPQGRSGTRGRVCGPARHRDRGGSAHRAGPAAALLLHPARGAPLRTRRGARRVQAHLPSPRRRRRARARGVRPDPRGALRSHPRRRAPRHGEW